MKNFKDMTRNFCHPAILLWKVNKDYLPGTCFSDLNKSFSSFDDIDWENVYKNVVFINFFEKDQAYKFIAWAKNFNFSVKNKNKKQTLTMRFKYDLELFSGRALTRMGITFIVPVSDGIWSKSFTSTSGRSNFEKISARTPLKP